MKKTLTINLGGTVFHIEEDAYRSLDLYLRSLRQSFKVQADCDEIISDIEVRMAEIFNEELQNKEQPVTLGMVERAIEVLGNPNDIADESNMNSSYSNYRGNSRKLYRDVDKKTIAGICAGLAHYLNMDLTLLRVIFAILLVLTSGSFGLVYLVLWIIVPEAVSTSQRMEMMGHPVTADRMSRERDKYKSKRKEKFDNATIDPNARTVHVKSGNVFEGIIKAFAWVIGGFFLFILLIVLLSIILAIFGVAVGASVAGVIFPDTFMISPEFLDSELVRLTSSSVFGLILFFGAPLVFILFIITKVLFKHKGKVGWAVLACFALWLLGSGMLMVSGTKIVKEAANLDVKIEGDDDEGMLVIDGDTIIRFREDSFDDKFKFELRSASNTKNFTYKQSVNFVANKDTLVFQQPIQYLPDADYKWVQPRVYLRSEKGLDKVSMEFYLTDYELRFKKFKLVDPKFEWKLGSGRVQLQDYMGFSNSTDANPKIVITVPQGARVKFEPGVFEMITNADSLSQNGTIQDAVYKFEDR